MPKAITTFESSDGSNHPSLAGATIADLAAILGSTPAAETVFLKRAAIEAVFAEHDAASPAKATRPIRAVIG